MLFEAAGEEGDRSDWVYNLPVLVFLAQECAECHRQDAAPER